MLRRRAENLLQRIVERHLRYIYRVARSLFLRFFARAHAQDYPTSDTDMPEQMPKGKTVKYGPDLILQRPSLAAQAINACANWALIENELTLIYSLLMGKYLTTLPNAEPPVHPVAL